MGFTEEQARSALAVSNGDLGAAINVLLEQPSAPPPPSRPARSAVAEQDERNLQAAIEASRLSSNNTPQAPPPPPTAPAFGGAVAAQNDKNLQAALEASRREAEAQQRKAQQEQRAAQQQQQRLAEQQAAQQRAAEAQARAAQHAQKSATSAPQRAALAAAEARMAGSSSSSAAAARPTPAPAFGIAPKGNPFSVTSAPAPAPAFRPAPAPAPSAPPPRREMIDISASTAEERVQLAAKRLSGRAEAVDILIASIGRVLQNPNDEKFRRVNPANPAFAKTVGNTPGGIEFLMAVGYEPLHGQLVLQTRDVALLWLGKAALEAARDSEAYLGSKETIEVEKALQQSVQVYDEEHTKRRAAFLKRVPPEPSEGAAGSTKLCVHVGSYHTFRRFDHDCTLEDVLNFVRSLEGTPIVTDARELKIADVTTRPAKKLDADTQLGLTLKSLGMWPSAQLRCRVNGMDEAYENAMLGIVRLPSEHRA